MNIKQTIQALVKEEFTVQVIAGKVINFNGQDYTCDIDLDIDPDILDVRIRSVIDGNDSGILIIPKIGSVVLVGLIDNKIESSFIITYSEIEEFRLITKKIELAGNQFGGLVKVEELTTKINNLENAILQMKSEFNSHMHNSPQAPSGTLVTLPPIVPSNINISPTQQSELENLKVKHG